MLGSYFKSLFHAPAHGVGGIPDQHWESALSLPVFNGLPMEERARLRSLGAALLADKTISPAAGATPDAETLAAIALQAALPILHLGYGWYDGWREIILYPAQFVPEREVTDDFGVVHRVRHPLSGEAWEGGPLVLSLDDVAESGHCQGYNVVIHEFAHKLDMRDGVANGRPPLGADLDAAAWASVFNTAYDDLCRRVDADLETTIDPYAAESPAEFFAVLSEYFFEWPEAVVADFPAVYEQLRRFYRQDPLVRLESLQHDPATPRPPT